MPCSLKNFSFRNKPKCKICFYIQSFYELYAGTSYCLERMSDLQDKNVIKRIFHSLWLNMIFIHLVMCFYRCAKARGQKTYNLLNKKMISNCKPWKIIYPSVSKTSYKYI